MQRFKGNGVRKDIAEYDFPAPCRCGWVSFPAPDAQCLAPAHYGFCVALNMVCNWAQTSGKPPQCCISVFRICRGEDDPFTRSSWGGEARNGALGGRGPCRRRRADGTRVASTRTRSKLRWSLVWARAWCAGVESDARRCTQIQHS